MHSWPAAGPAEQAVEPCYSSPCAKGKRPFLPRSRSYAHLSPEHEATLWREGQENNPASGRSKGSLPLPRVASLVGTAPVAHSREVKTCGILMEPLFPAKACGLAPEPRILLVQWGDRWHRGMRSKKHESHPLAPEEVFHLGHVLLQKKRLSE